ncbi:MAG: hypothetical protein DRN96_05020 [Thermoproteota archaeon]|nr:MAG: hypothetical protein DRN96_05020 [Candidatus Korarchaeota archaeon]
MLGESLKIEYNDSEDKLTIRLSSEKADRVVQVNRVSIGYSRERPVFIQISGGLDFAKAATRACLKIREEDPRSFTVKMQSFSKLLRTAAERELSAIAAGLTPHGKFLLAVLRGKPVGGLYLTSKGRLEGDHAVFKILRDIRRERGAVRVVLCSSAMIQELAKLYGAMFTGMLAGGKPSSEMLKAVKDLTNLVVSAEGS